MSAPSLLFSGAGRKLHLSPPSNTQSQCSLPLTSSKRALHFSAAHRGGEGRKVGWKPKSTWKSPQLKTSAEKIPESTIQETFFFFEVLIVCRLSGRLCVASLLFLLAGSFPVWKGRTVVGAVNCRASGGQSSDRPGKRFSVVITENSLALLFPFYISSVL